MKSKIKNKNCPNCGSPYEIYLNKCPYCGTSYFDMSCIDIDSGEPFYLKLKTNMGTIIQKVVVQSDVTIDISSNTVDITDRQGNAIKSLTRSNAVSTNITFEGVTDSDGTMYKVIQKGEIA